MSHLFELDLTSTSGTINLHTEVPVQDLILKEYRVEFSSSSQSVTAKQLYVKLPFFGATQLNSNVSRRGIPLLLGGSAVTIQQCDLPMALSKVIPEHFQYSIDAVGATTGLVRVTLLFSYDVGAIH